ncbi:unnamed protein product [marine sediment metagenome]|uniref:Uncharacterized protein n=1 Tax=marine sediment metagenome TaxID=412755 RepID=X1GQ67_9ZZZZ
MELEEKTDQMIDGALKILMKYDLKVSKTKRHKNLADKIDMGDAVDKIIEIRQFMLTNRSEYNQDKFKIYCNYVDLLANLCDDMNNMKYYAMARE